MGHSTKSSPSIWTLYIDFEVRNGELERAKALIYRALRECPWCKGESAERLTRARAVSIDDEKN